MPLFPDATRLGRAALRPRAVSADPTKPINDVVYEDIKATGGTRTITYISKTTGASATTAALAYNANAATIKAAFDALGSAVADGVTVTVLQSNEGEIIRNTYNFAGMNNEDVGRMLVDGTSLTGGEPETRVRVYEGSSFNGLGAREATQDALAAVGNRRQDGSFNELTAYQQRKPRDIGDPLRYNPDGSPKDR